VIVPTSAAKAETQFEGLSQRVNGCAIQKPPKNSFFAVFWDSCDRTEATNRSLHVQLRDKFFTKF
jgi:hypothetical protein